MADLTLGEILLAALQKARKEATTPALLAETPNAQPPVANQPPAVETQSAAA